MHAWLAGWSAYALLLSLSLFQSLILSSLFPSIVVTLCIHIYIGSFWLNPPLPMDEEGNWVGETRPGGSGASNLADVDPWT